MALAPTRNNSVVTKRVCPLFALWRCVGALCFFFAKRKKRYWFSPISIHLSLLPHSHFSSRSSLSSLPSPYAPCWYDQKRKGISLSPSLQSHITSSKPVAHISKSGNGISGARSLLFSWAWTLYSPPLPSSLHLFPSHPASLYLVHSVRYSCRAFNSSFLLWPSLSLSASLLSVFFSPSITRFLGDNLWNKEIVVERKECARRDEGGRELPVERETLTLTPSCQCISMQRTLLRRQGKDNIGEWESTCPVPRRGLQLFTQKGGRFTRTF